MNIILLEKVRNLGLLGDHVAVKPGFARNYLIPQGKAVFATPSNIEMFKERKAELEAKEADKLSQAQKRAEDLAQDRAFVIESRSGDEGKLYGSIGTRDVADLITAQGCDVLKQEVKMPEGPIRTTGDHVVTIHLHSDVIVDVTINVVPLEQTH